MCGFLRGARREGKAPDAGRAGRKALEFRPASLDDARVADPPDDALAFRTALAAWLAPRVEAAGPVDVDAVRKPPGGMSSETTLATARFRDARGEARELALAVRAAPREEGPFPEYDLRLQHDAMRALATHTRAPVPDVLWLEEDASVLGTPFLVMRAIDCWAPLDRPSYQAEGLYVRMTPDERRRAWRAAIEALVPVHAADWRALGIARLPGGRQGEDAATAALAYWRRYVDGWIKRDPSEREPVLDAALAWLERERPRDARLALAWGDAKLGNVLFAPDGSTVRALVDWEMCGVGAPEADLASLHFSDLRAQDEAGGAAREGTPSEAELVALYEAAGGAPVRHLHYWSVFSAFWRGAVQVKVMKRLRAQGVELPDALFDQSFPFRRLRALLGDALD